MVRSCVRSRNLVNEEALAYWGLLRQIKKNIGDSSLLEMLYTKLTGKYWEEVKFLDCLISKRGEFAPPDSPKLLSMTRLHTRYERSSAQMTESQISHWHISLRAKQPVSDLNRRNSRWDIALTLFLNVFMTLCFNTRTSFKILLLHL